MWCNEEAIACPDNSELGWADSLADIRKVHYVLDLIGHHEGSGSFPEPEKSKGKPFLSCVYVYCSLQKVLDPRLDH